MSVFKPLMYQKSILNINYSKLKKKGIEMLIFDLDNTVLMVGEDLPEKEVVDLFQKLNKDFKVVIASNNIQRKVKRIADYLQCDYLYSMMKPTKKIKKYLDKRYKLNGDKVAIIGDQVVTDIFVGNRLGLHTILVDPLSDTDYKITFFNRFLEKRIMKRMKFKKGEYYEEE
jgi:HAD superfamily phosphatase (TIGR01668 family)